MKKFTRERVVPTIPASVSCDILGMVRTAIISLLLLVVPSVFGQSIADAARANRPKETKIMTQFIPSFGGVYAAGSSTASQLTPVESAAAGFLAA
jgi:hypothetical protein